MQKTAKRNFNEPDSTMNAMEKIDVATVNIEGAILSRVTAEPGWVWSVHSKPVQKTDSCQVDHLFYVISGEVGTKDNDGRETIYGAGDLAHIPRGHDGWTIGDKSVSWVELPH